MSKIILSVEVVCMLTMIIAISGQRFQWMPFGAAFGGFMLALAISAITALVALILLAVKFGAFESGQKLETLAAFTIGLVPLLMSISMVGAGLKVPRIHNISTNLDDNIAFQHAQGLRKPSENSLEFPSADVEAMHRQHYTELTSLTLQADPKDAYISALKVAKDLGWEVTYEQAENGYFEALDRTAIFGFIDDIVVRIRPSDTGVIVDTRSVSRVGQSDLGANAKRIQAFQKALKDALTQS